MSRRKLSCFVIACNEEDRIERCLASLAGWVDQLIVLDSGSTDNTVSIAHKYADSVIETDWPGFGAQRNRALTYCEHDWVLNIDADEVVTEGLKNEILAVLAQPELDYTMVKVPWHTYFLGKLLKRGRYSAPQGKLFYKPGAKFKSASVHESLILPIEKVLVLKQPLIHYSWRDYEHAVEKHVKYACLGAQDKFNKGKRTSLLFACLRFVTDFIQQYVFRLGCLDGKQGFMMALILAQYGFHKYAALWAMQQSTKAQSEEPNGK